MHQLDAILQLIFRHYSMPLATMLVENVSVVNGIVEELKKTDVAKIS